MRISFSTSSNSVSISTSNFIAWNVFAKKFLTVSTTFSFLRTRITAGLLNKPKIPLFSSSTTSYSIWSLVVSIWIKAFVKASSAVFAENSFHSSILNSSYFLSFFPESMCAYPAILPDSKSLFT